MGHERGLEKRRGGRLGNLGMLFVVSIFLGSFLLLPLATALAAEDWPTRAITVINGSAVGGFVDTVARPFAHEMSKVLGVPIMVTSITGGGGGIAAQNVYQASADGYTWQAQGAQIRVMGVMGYHESGPKDWYALPLVGYLAAFVVREDSPYKSFPDLLEAMKKNPDKIPFGCSYLSTAWGVMMGIFRKATGLWGRHIPYNGGAPTLVALLSGDIQFAMNGVGEQAELLRGKKIRALAVFHDKPYYLKGYGEIPAITTFVPELKPYLPYLSWTSFSFRSNTPKPILKKIDETYLKVVHTKPMEEFYERSLCFPLGIVGDDAQKLYHRQTSTDSWLLYEAGLTKRSPVDFGIPKP